MIFGTRSRKKPKKYAKEREFPSWKDVTVWKDFIPSYVSEAT